MLASLAAISPDRTKMTSDDRILVLEIVNGKRANDSLIDNAVFDGKNNIHAVLQLNNLWTLKLEHGFLPSYLRDKAFTNFNRLLKYVEDYFSKRGIKVKEIVDVWP